MKTKKMYTVTIGDKTTRIKAPTKDIVLYQSAVSDIYGDVSEYDGGNHNYSGLTGWIIFRAVEKLFGKKCFWFGNYDNKSVGQVFEATKYGNSSRTNTVVISIE